MNPHIRMRLSGLRSMFTVTLDQGCSNRHIGSVCAMNYGCAALISDGNLICLCTTRESNSIAAIAWMF